MQGATEFELCRKILMRLEEVMLRDGPNLPVMYEMEGYDNELVDYWMQKLYGARLIDIKMRTTWTRPDIRYWPVSFIGRGLDVLAVSKDEGVWTEALMLMGEREKVPTVKMLAHYLLDVVRKEKAV